MAVVKTSAVFDVELFLRRIADMSGDEMKAEERDIREMAASSAELLERLVDSMD